MAKTKDNYQVTGNTVPELVRNLNFLLQRLADRMDKLEGIRGTPDDLVVAGNISVLDETAQQIHSME